MFFVRDGLVLPSAGRRQCADYLAHVRDWRIACALRGLLTNAIAGPNRHTVRISSWHIPTHPHLPHMTRTTLFHSNRSQAVRLPKDVAFPEGVKEVAILRDGKRRGIVPANVVWDDFFDAPGIDLPPREQPKAQRRDPL